MAVTIKRISSKDALDAVGLGVTSYAIGTRVQLIAKSGPWKYVCKTGAIGTVEKCARANAPNGKPSPDDLYFVRLDSLPEKIVYITFKELQVVKA